MASFNLKEQEWNQCLLGQNNSDLPRVELSLTFDSECLKINAVVHDTHFKDGERSWRYGDGFLMNFITEINSDRQESGKFYAYGFSIVAGKRVTTLVNRNGTYFLTQQSHQPEIQVDLENKCATYKIDVPWRMLSPFHPLLCQTMGINILYTSQSDDGSRKFLQLVEDENFDSESKVEKKYMPVHFAFSDKSELQFIASLNSNLVHRDEILARIVIYSRRKLQTIITILVSDKNGKTVFQSESKITLEAGLIELKEKLPAPVGTGAYSLCVRFQEGLKCELNFYKLGSDELSRFEESLQKLEIIVHDPLELSSYYGLKYKFRELVNQIDSFEPGEPPKVIEEAIDNFKQLLERCKIHHHLYTEEGYIRTAFLSRVDRSLQPYSIYLPENFDRELRYKLIVALHGSGVDEVAFLKSTGAKLAGSKYIVVAPRGRELSDWYIGQTETDILDMITVLKGMFHIEETLAYGFSMGGFGVWRLIFRAPILFAGAMIISGAIRNPSDESSLHDELWSQPSIKEIPVLVMHGAEDRAVPVCDVKDFVQGLQRQGFNICFKEVDGAGHGNYGYAGVIESWLIRHGL